MLLINRPQTNPYFNIAAEEYLLKHKNEDCFMLWQNEPSIIIGKHQNTLAEINYNFVVEHKIPVVRRISGGGTVFHDLGNLNFTFISSGEKEKLVNFRKFTQPIIDVLNQMGIPAKFEGKNDLRVNGLKISGNAEHVFKNKVLHHGTLLFSSDLDFLNQAIKVIPKRFKDKAVQSVRSKVANISNFLKEDISIEMFKDRIIHHIQQSNSEIHEYALSQEDIEGIENLVKQKYNTWKWNFGYSPAYIIKTKLYLYGQYIPVGIFVKNGIIEELKLQQNTNVDIDFLEMILVGKMHNPNELNILFKQNKRYLEYKGLNTEELIELMF